MKHTFNERVAELVRSNRKHKRWTRGLSGMIVLVVLITTYMLILPAITLGNETVCGLTEHTHTDACYELRLVCTQTEDAEHTHTAACYPSSENVCGKEESAGHTHTDACYTVTQTLSCGETESAGHTHGSGCYDEEGNLVCTEAESAGHTHSAACYTEERTLTCGKEESAGHTHSAACQGEASTTPICGLEQGSKHTHNETCYEKVLICNLPEHTHSDACYENAAEQEVILENGFPTELPEGYASYEYVDENGLSVLAYAPEDAFGGVPVTLEADRLAADSEEYAAAEANLDAEGVERDGFLALDIRFVNAEDEEVEPNAESGSVYIQLTGAALIPEEAVANSVAVQHHKAENDALLGFIPAGERIVVEVVADRSEDTGDVTVIPGNSGEASDVKAAFPVESFSVFTLTWKSTGYTLPIQCINIDGTAVSGDNQSATISGTVTAASIAPTISGQTYSKAVVASSAANAVGSSATTILRLRRSSDGSSGTWQYNTSSGGGTWTNISSNTIYFIYTLPTVATVDTISQGITINVFDYDGTNINNGRKLKFTGSNAGNTGSPSWSSSPWNVWSLHDGGVYQGILRNTLDTNDYPLLNSAKFGSADSLAYLFSPTTTASGKTTYANANYLFQRDANGYYHYNSGTNFAKLNTTTKVFTVYDRAINNGTAPGDPKFLPFNEITDSSGYDYHFGMTVDTDFLMPKNGKVNSNDMVFEFEGDDDVWVFIDGALVLDMGGIHDNYSGSINFATGVVTISNVNTGSQGSSNAYSSTLYTLMTAAKGSTWVSQNMVQKSGAWIFKDYSSHSFSFFYTERGAGGSNCKIRFNLPTIPHNSLMIGKDLGVLDTQASEDLQTYLNNLTFNFRVLKRGASPSTTSASDLFLGAGTTYTLMDSTTGLPVNSTVYTVGTDGIITIKPGQIAVLANAYTAASDEYYVQELVGSNFTGQYGVIQYSIGSDGGTTVVMDGNVVIGSTTFSGYNTGLMNPANEQNNVTFTNKVDIDQLSLLKIEKRVLPGSVSIGANTEFEMYVTIGGEPLPVGTVYQLADNTEKTVTQSGIVKLKNGEIASLSILAGATYQVQETNAASYNVTYAKTAKDSSGNPIANPSGNNYSGTVDQVHSTIHITVTNADYDFVTSLPLQKTLLGAGVTAKSFTFDITEMTFSGGNYTVKTGGKAFQTSIGNLTSSNPTGNETIYFGFKSTTSNGDYYFRITEVQPGSADGVNYDTNYYIVRVNVSQSGGVKSASVTNVTKYDKNGNVVADFTWSAGNPATFTNSMVGSLSLTKQVVRTDGLTPNANDEFIFTVSIPAAYAGSYAAAYSNTGGPTHSNGTTLFTAAVGSDDAVAQVKLYHNETVVISGLPAAVRAKITETGAGGYAVNWAGDIFGGVSSATITTEDIYQNPAVVCTNTTGAVLPTTGGSGSGLILTLGAALTIFAGGLLLKQQRRKGGDRAI